MKKCLLFLAFLVMVGPGFAQESSLKDIFAKFEGMDGVSVISLDKDMLKAFLPKDTANAQVNSLADQVTGIKILSFDKASQKDKDSFAQMAMNASFKDFKELLSVKEKNQTIKILIKGNESKISEFIIIVYGGKDSALVNVTGNMDNKILDEIKSKMGQVLGTNISAEKETTK